MIAKSFGTGSRFAMTLNALSRRLEAAGATEWERKTILEEQSHRIQLEQAMREELARSTKLEGEARSVLLHDPSFVVKASEVVGRPRFDLRSIQSCFFLVGGAVCYTVRDNTVTTTIKVEDHQRREVEALVGPFRDDVVSPVVQELIGWARRASHTRPRNVTPKPTQIDVVLKVPGWLREQGAAWHILVLDDTPSRDAALALAVHWLTTSKVGKEETVFIDVGSSVALFSLRNWLTKNGTARLLLHLPVTGGDRIAYAQEAMRWWKNVFKAENAHTSRLIMVVGPATARAILLLLETGGISLSPLPGQDFASGTVLTLAWTVAAGGVAFFQVTTSPAN